MFSALILIIPIWGVTENLCSQPENIPVTDLEPNAPFTKNDLAQYSTHCFRTPVHANSVIIEASVTGLTGNPTVVGDWTPSCPPNDSKNYGGFAIWSKPSFTEAGTQRTPVSVPNGNDQYYTCVTTYSEQGCDFVITVYVEEDSVRSPAIIPLGVPSIWMLDQDARTFRLSKDNQIAGGRNPELDTEFILTPLEGEAHMKRIDCTDATKELNQKSDLRRRLDPERELKSDDNSIESEGTNWLKVNKQNDDICIKVLGKRGELISLEASQGIRTVAHTIPLTVRIPAKEECSGPLQTVVNPKTSITLVATNNLIIYADLKTASKDSFKWKGEKGYLDVPHEDFDELTENGELHFRVCLSTQPVSEDVYTFITTSSGSNSMITLPEGQALRKESKHQNHDATGRWQDFRFFIPSTEAYSTFTLKANAINSESTKIIMVADIVHYSHNPKAYRWSVPIPYQSNAELTFTLDPSEAKNSDGTVHLIDCRPPCFLYATLFSFDHERQNEKTEYDIELISDFSLVEIQDGINMPQTLGAGRKQNFHYAFPPISKDLKNPNAAAGSHRTVLTSPVLLSTSCTRGAIKFRVSSRYNFQPDPNYTTAWGKEVVLLDPELHLLRDALRTSSDTANTAEESSRQDSEGGLYIQLHNQDDKISAECVLNVRLEHEVEKLQNGGSPINGAFRRNEWNRYQVELLGGKDTKDQKLHINLEALAGDPNLYVSYSDPYVTGRNAVKTSEMKGSDTIDISTNIEEWTGKVYISVSAEEESAYNLNVYWGADPVISLVDGIRTHVSMNKGEDEMISVNAAGEVRIEVLTGAITMCPKAPNAATVFKELCVQLNAKEARNRLSNLILPSAMYINLKSEEDDTKAIIWGAMEAALTISEGEVVRDRLEPSTEKRIKTRRYQIFVLPLVHRIHISVNPEDQTVALHTMELRARIGGGDPHSEVWPFNASYEGEHLILDFTGKDARRLANRWLDLEVIVSIGSPPGRAYKFLKEPLDYTLSVDYGALQLEDQELLLDAPVLPVNTSLFSSKLYSFAEEDRVNHMLTIMECMNSIRVLAGPSIENMTDIGFDEKNITDRGAAEELVHQLRPDDKIALIITESGHNDAVLGDSSYEVGLKSINMEVTPNTPVVDTKLIVSPRPASQLGYQVSFNIPDNASKVRAYFIKRKLVGVFHLTSPCGLRAMENTVINLKDNDQDEDAELYRENLRVEEVPVKKGRTTILAPWGATDEEWAANVMWEFPDGSSEVGQVTGNFDVTKTELRGINTPSFLNGLPIPIKNTDHLMHMIMIFGLCYCFLGFLYNRKVYRLQGVQAIPGLSSFVSVRRYDPQLEVPLQRANDPYMPLEEFYQPPKLPAAMEPLEQTSSAAGIGSGI